MKSHLFTTCLVSLFLTSLLGIMAANLPAIAKPGLPGRRVVGGTRSGPCFPDYFEKRHFTSDQDKQAGIFPIALVPESRMSLTTLAQPKIFWYQPTFRSDREGLSAAPTTEQVTFLLASRQTGAEVYRTTVRIPTGQSGIYSVTLPPDVALAVGEVYDWGVTPICRANDPELNSLYAVGGAIQRVAVGTSPDIGPASPKAIALAKRNLWNDALTTLAAAYCDRPNDPSLTPTWAEMLGLLNLEADGVDPNLFQVPSLAHPRFACEL